MAIGITAYSAYIPRRRLGRAKIAAAWGSRAVPGSKAVVNFDEDALTMAQAAVWRLLPAAPEIDRIYFASTTAPFWQRSSASLVAAHCDLPAEVATADFGGTLRCGTSALGAALDAVAAGSGGRGVVVVASDARAPRPESPEEMIFGDAAAAVAVGRERVVAEVVAVASRSDDFLDEWRRDSDAHVHSFASKFSLARGYHANVVAVAGRVMEAAGIGAGEISRAVLASPDGAAHLAAASALGIPAERVEDTRAGDIGVTGSAMPLLLLAQALDRAASGDLILVVAYGEGADGLLLRVTSEIARLPRPCVSAEASVLEYPTYEIYRKLRSGDHAGEAAEVSNVLWEREETQNVRLHGTFCPGCGTLQFPITRVCVKCRNAEGLLEKPLARTGRLFTYTKDYLYDAPVQPTIMAIVDLDGGGRLLCQMTDADEQEVEIGMEVELVLRRMRPGPSMHHYYWKGRPVRGGSQ